MNLKMVLLHQIIYQDQEVLEVQEEEKNIIKESINLWILQMKNFKDII